MLPNDRSAKGDVALDRKVVPIGTKRCNHAALLYIYSRFSSMKTFQSVETPSIAHNDAHGRYESISSIPSTGNWPSVVDFEFVMSVCL